MSKKSPKKTYYSKKENALKQLTDNHILCNRGITKYFIADDYSSFLNIILASKKRDYYEYIPADVPVKLFFDIEIYKGNMYFDNESNESNESLLDILFERINGYFANFKISKIILESHNENKKSFHIIFKIFNASGHEVMFSNVLELKKLWKQLNLDDFHQTDNKGYLIDPSVYRAGLFRTIYSSKNEEPPRPLVYSKLSDEFNDLDTFVCYIDSENKVFFEFSENSVVSNSVVNSPEELAESDKQLIKRFIQREYSVNGRGTRDIFVDKSKNCIVIALYERYCNFIEREHQSNNQYIIIDTTSSKQRCHDPDCSSSKHHEIKMEDYPKELNVIIKKCLKVNKQELDLIDHAIEECKSYINENFDSVDAIHFDKKEMVFRGDVTNKSLMNIIGGKCTSCQIEHQISNTGYCMKCIVCKSIFPKNQVIPVDNRYKNLNNFWANYTQLVNNGTVNINIYQNSEEDFACDIQLENSILKDKELTRIYNQVLDGHKITKLAEVIYYLNKDYVYTKNNWYYFNGSIWKLDEDNLNMKRSILDSTSSFNKICNFYERKKDNTQQLVKNIKSLITKLNKPGFKDDIIKEAKMFYNDPDFVSKLNSKKHLVPFTNGVYDLLTSHFRQTVKDDYINLTVGFPCTTEENPEVYRFLEEVLPNKGVREYVLKRMSECLNGDIPNTYFLMFIGDTGANGKSQLLNLMKLTMGEFGEKVEVTLLTRKRNNANESNSEKIKLLNKRFAFLSEPEDGEKINIGLLKELTGSEEIVARGLYQDSLSFVMEAKLFLACNELPEIKGEDTALWRRIRAIDFPSRFVDDPKGPGEFKIDRTLPSRMREDLSWRQTFMNILLRYYSRDDIREPDEVKIKTNEYQMNNDPNRKFVTMYLEKKSGCGVNWTKLWNCYQKWYIEENGSCNLKKVVVKKYFEDRVFKTKYTPVSKDIGRGWCGWRIREELFDEINDELE